MNLAGDDTGGRSGPTRTAVVGAGFIADFHLEVLAGLPDARVVCVVDADLGRAQAAAERFGVAEAAADLDRLSELGVEVAHLCVPPDRHAEVARELLARGIAVFAEKPLALSSREAYELAGIAEAAGVALGVNHNALFQPAFARLTRRLRAGEIGRVEHVQITLNVPLRQLDAGDFSHWMFRAPRNIVFEQGPHPFAQLLELIGPVVRMTPVTFGALGTRELLPGRIFHQRWCLAAEAERGTAEVYLGFGTSFTRNTIQVLGSDGALEADLHHDLVSGERKTVWLDFWNSFLAGWRRGGELRRGALRVLWNYGRRTLGLGPRQDAFYVGMRASIRAFHEALRAGLGPPCDAEDGARVLEWCEAAVATLPAPEPERVPPPSEAPARAGEVVVLGASGFIGRHTVARLLACDASVTAVVRRLHSLPPVLADERVRLLLADLEDDEALRAAVRGARVVIHLATGGGDTWAAVERAMVRGTARLAEACLDENVERLVYVSSTSALYLGHDCGSITLEDDVPPDPKPAGRSLYARGKIAAEAELMRLHKERGLPVTIVRPAAVVGPDAPLQHGGLGLWVRDNHCVGWGRGDRPVPLVLVDDVAEALALVALHEGAELDGRAMNLAARVSLTAPEVVAAWRDATGRDLHFHPRSLWVSQLMEIGKWVVKRVGGRDAPFPSYRDLKTRQMWPTLTCERARRTLGWRPVEDRDELLARLIPKP
ncbi:MAG: NAD-dependent epimerase/dehydratase family protein [Planctomycetota bacterium]|nr:NAD-dependent epimerase/dehydratase family protein [Planctomycetota bacterium]